MKLFIFYLFFSFIRLSHACIEFVEVAYEDGVKLEGVTVNHQIVFKDNDSKKLDGLKLLKVIDYKTQKEVKNLFKLNYNILSINPVTSKEERASLSGSFEITLVGNDKVSRSLLLVVKKSEGKNPTDALSDKSLVRAAKSSGCGGRVSMGKYR